MQIKYRDVDGNVGLRVITDAREQTKEKAAAEQESDARVLGTWAAQNVPLMQKKGQFATVNNMLKQLKGVTEGTSKPESAQIVEQLDKLMAQNLSMHSRMKKRGRSHDDDEVDGYRVQRRAYISTGFQLESCILESACIPESASVGDDEPDQGNAANEEIADMEDIKDEHQLLQGISDEVAEQMFQWQRASFI